MLPTGSVFRISTTLPEGSSTSAAPVTPRKDGSLPSECIAELSVQILGVRRSAVFQWKPGIRIATSSYSALRQRRMSGVIPSPVLACRTRLDSDYCSCPLDLDGDPDDLMIEFVGGWYLALTIFHNPNTLI